MTNTVRYTLYNVGFDWENIFVENAKGETVRKYPSPPTVKSGPLLVQYPPLGESVDVDVPVGKDANLTRLIGFSNGKLSLQPLGTPTEEQQSAQEVIDAVNQRNKALAAERDDLAAQLAALKEQVDALTAAQAEPPGDNDENLTPSAGGMLQTQDEGEQNAEESEDEAPGGDEDAATSKSRSKSKGKS